jgi:hypothetical protein
MAPAQAITWLETKDLFPVVERRVLRPSRSGRLPVPVQDDWEAIEVKLPPVLVGVIDSIVERQRLGRDQVIQLAILEWLGAP